MFDIFADPHVVATLKAFCWGAGSLMVFVALVYHVPKIQRIVLPFADTMQAIEDRAKGGDPHATLGVTLGHCIYKGLLVLAVAHAGGIVG